MADIEQKSQNDAAEQIPKQQISEAVHYDKLYIHQKMLYYILYPLIFVLDISCISKRTWIQIPLLTYFIEVTQLMMAITFVQVHIQGLETRATRRKITAETVTWSLFLFTVTIAIICLTLLYCLRRFTTATHYIYLVHLSINLVGVGLLYLCVIIQYEYFSDTANSAWSWFFILLGYACVSIGVIILIKIFILKQSLTDHLIKQYRKYYKLYKLDLADNAASSETVALISNNSDFSAETLADEMDNFVCTVFMIVQQMWAIPIGFVLIECVVYMFINDYVNLLVRWQEFQHMSSILNNIWPIIIFGLLLAIVAAVMEGFMELKCKVPCYQFVHNRHNRQLLDNGNRQAPGCYHQCLVFILNWLNEVGILWFDILAACIGWSLLTPGQATAVWVQFKWAMLGTLAFVIFGVLTEKYRLSRQEKIFSKIEKIKNEESDKEAKLMNNVRSLIFYDKMHKTYNAAFAVAVSFAWETFIQLALENTVTGLVGLENHWLTLVLTFVYAVFIGFAFTELGLLLTDLRIQRLQEMHLKNKNINPE